MLKNSLGNRFYPIFNDGELFEKPVFRQELCFDFYVSPIKHKIKSSRKIDLGRILPFTGDCC